MTAKMTRAEFVRNLEREGITAPERVAEHAECAGVEWLPEQTEPKVGDALTKATRLVDAMIVHLPRHAHAAVYNAMHGRWDVTGIRPSMAHEDMGSGWRIVFVPGEPVTEQKHETTVIKVVGMWDWRCTCGCHGRNYESRSAAYYWAERHDGTHVAAQS